MNSAPISHLKAPPLSIRGFDPFRVGITTGDAIRGRRAQKACPCPRLLNFHPFGVVTTPSRGVASKGGGELREFGRAGRWRRILNSAPISHLKTPPLSIKRVRPLQGRYYHWGRHPWAAGTKSVPLPTATQFRPLRGLDHASPRGRKYWWSNSLLFGVVTTPPRRVASIGGSTPFSPTPTRRRGLHVLAEPLTDPCAEASFRMVEKPG